MAIKSTKVPEIITDGVKEITRVADDAISGVTNAVPQVLYGPAPRTDEMDLDEEIKGELIEFQEDLYGPPPKATNEGQEGTHGHNGSVHVTAPEVIYGPPPAPTESSKKNKVEELIDKMTDPSHYE